MTGRSGALGACTSQPPSSRRTWFGDKERVEDGANPFSYSCSHPLVHGRTHVPEPRRTGPPYYPIWQLSGPLASLSGD